MKIIAKNTSLVFQILHQHTYGANMFDNPVAADSLPSGRYVYSNVGAVSGAWLNSEGASAANSYSADYTVSAVAEVNVGDKYIFSGTGFSQGVGAVVIYGCSAIADGTNMTSSANTSISTCKVLSYNGTTGDTKTNEEITITQEMINAVLAAVPGAAKFVIRAYGKSSNTLVLKKILD